MGASYPKGHIPQDVYEQKQKEKKAKDEKIVDELIETSKLRAEMQETEKPKIKILTEVEVWKLKYKEQFDLLKKLDNYTNYDIRKKFQYEKDRVREIMRLQK